jgi:hypothetical protein
MSEVTRQNLEKAVGSLREAQGAASKAERKFLLLTGWEDQGTDPNGTTWWFKEGYGCSYEQRNAVKFELIDQERQEKRSGLGTN